MLGDPFMQNIFGASITKDITATSMPSDLTVLELPVEGRPPYFSGAVGSFKIAGDISSTTAAAGDPLTLRMHVTGTGNFDRVDSAMLEHLDQWKTYPPKSSFKASDTLGLKGEKIFEQPLIASKPGTQSLPGLAFSYFDPSAHRYETVRSAPLNVTISPSLADSSLNAQPNAAPNASPNAPPLPTGTASSAGLAATAASNSGLRPDHVVTEAGSDTLVPPYLQPRFLMIPSLLALSFAGGWWGLRRRAADSSGARGRRRGASKDSNRVLQGLATAARAGDAASFFTLALAALERAAPTELEAERFETGRLEAEPGVELEAGRGDENDDIRRFLALADEVNYAGRRPTPAEFERWIQFIRDAFERGAFRRDTLQRDVRQPDVRQPDARQRDPRQRDELPSRRSS